MTTAATTSPPTTRPVAATPTETLDDPPPSAEVSPGSTLDRMVRSEGCPERGPTVGPVGPAVSATVLNPPGDGGPLVEAVVYPHPDYEGKPWSQWGQGVTTETGRFLSGIGDQLGIDGNTYLYDYDPASSRLIQTADVLDLVGHRSGEWGYGKLHAQMVSGRCGEVFFATYWGTRRGLSSDSSYAGDWLLRWDPSKQSVTPLLRPLPRRGIPSLAGWSTGGLLYGEAVDPESDDGDFFVYDTVTNEIVATASDVPHAGFRNVLVDGAGSAFFSAGDSQLQKYDPVSGEVAPHPDRLPGSFLRASTRPALDGTVYGVTQDPPVLFSLDPDGRITEMGPARGYVTSLALSADDSTLFYVPGAHGDSWEQDSPVIAVDVATARESVLIRLNELAERKLGLRLGGSYNVVADPSGRYLFVGFNAGRAGEASFGEVVLAVVHLP